ncbi:hypothetical protein C8R43DRAFT_1127311 [Mycena crocata]|nr:hypothetical protein C8R43DRAFT_1127311 [Mycena crocata]
MDWPKISWRARQLPMQGYVSLYLLEDKKMALSIPTALAHSFCPKDMKYLRFLSWIILGQHGRIHQVTKKRMNCQLTPVEDDTEYADKGIYQFKPTLTANVERAVNPHALSSRSSSSVASNQGPREHVFRAGLIERDHFCVFTGRPREMCQAAHIIPFARGDKWMQMISAHYRPKTDEAVIDINDLRNGMLLESGIHTAAAGIGILKTPNEILSIGDVPASQADPIDRRGVSYPRNVQYTLHTVGSSADVAALLNGRKAAFAEGTPVGKLPAGYLCHYAYAATVLECWGPPDLETFLKNNARAPPSAEAPALGPKRTHHKKGATYDKRHPNSPLKATLPRGKTMGTTPSDASPVVIAFPAGNADSDSDSDQGLDTGSDTKPDAVSQLLLGLIESPQISHRRAAGAAEKSNRITRWLAGLTPVTRK